MEANFILPFGIACFVGGCVAWHFLSTKVSTAIASLEGRVTAIENAFKAPAAAPVAAPAAPAAAPAAPKPAA